MAHTELPAVRLPAASRSGLVPIALVLSLALACATPEPPLPLYTESALIDGVAVRVTARDRDEARARAALTVALDAAREVGSRLLGAHETSEIAVLIDVPAHVWIAVSEATGDTLKLAFDIAEATDGAYDPSIPPLRELWGVRPGDEPNAPKPYEVESALRRVDFTDIELERESEYQVRRRSRRTELDLGALARGAMLDAALAQLRAAGIPAGRASTMGEHTVYGGTKERPWEIRLLIRGQAAAGIQERVGAIDVLDGAVAVASQGPTSFAPDGSAIHDRFDARTGYPVQGTRWLAVETDSASAAGGWVDAIFALGPEGRAFVEGDERLRAVIVPDDGELWKSEGLRFEQPQP